ncbi:MAG: class 1 fructose-bisphosphatase [Acidobacteriota bacterium]
MPIQKGITVERFIAEGERASHARGVFSYLLHQIQLAAKVITRDVRKAGLVEILGFTGRKNVQGEDVLKLDAFAQETIVSSVAHTGTVCVMCSEEVDDLIRIPEPYQHGKYVFYFDPLDGSSNVDANVNIGTIFAVGRRTSEGEGPGTREDCLQPGKNLVAAGYVLYGSSTMLVYTTGRGVHGFTLDPSVGEFLLSHPDIKIPPRGKIYSVNEANSYTWGAGTRKYVDWVKTPDKASGRPYSTRYIGSLVADFHRNLLYGGIFLYPGDERDPAKPPQGKLRLLYEANPLAFVAEQAGGAASTGRERILDIEPTSLHQRVPLIIGSRDDVKMAEEFIRGN